MAPKRRRQRQTTPSSVQQVYRQVPVIQVLGKLSKGGGVNKKLQGKILELSPETVRAVGNITLNALNNHIPMSTRQKSELMKREAEARKLAAPNGSLAVKRKIIQEGGFPPFLASLIPIVAGIVARQIEKRL